MSLAKRMDMWEEEFRQEGMQQGIQKERLSFAKMLASSHYGKIPKHIAHTLEKASSEELRLFIKNMLEQQKATVPA